MDVTEIVTLEDLEKFLGEHNLSMTMHAFRGKVSITLTLKGGGQPLVGEGADIETALQGAWAQK